jgi:MFS family permease
VQSGSLKALAVFTSIFFLASNLSGTFIVIYFRDMGLGILGIIEILFITFIIIGLLPLALLKSIKNFESVINLGVFFTMLFYIALIFIRHPAILGLAYGLSTATFWPSFNLLQFRLGESKVRARTISLFSVVIPSIASIIGPATGGFIIQNFGFMPLFATVIILYFVALLFSINIRFKPETCCFQIPKSRRFTLFFITFILLGFIESYWLAYPFFVYNISGTVLYMGLVYTFSAILITVLAFLVSWFSDIKLARVKFAIVGAMLNALWYFAIAFTSTTYQIVALALLSGLAGAFSLSWFAHYGDSFRKEYYASILVMMEVGLMIGRAANLMPTYIFIKEANYASYFILLGIASLLLVSVFAVSRSKDNVVK